MDPPDSCRHSHHHPHREGRRPRDNDSRSRSPRPHPDSSSRLQKRRQRSPLAHHHGRKRDKPVQAVLPNNARNLVKGDFAVFRPLLALYLDIQKGKDIDTMTEREVKGRWKSFFCKWNRGELSSGYYDPETLRKAAESSASSDTQRNSGHDNQDRGIVDEAENDSSSEDEMGPALPSRQERTRRQGPNVPGRQDLEMKREMEEEDRQARLNDIRYARKNDRTEQKALLEELLPRSDMGRERQLEKKKLLNEKLKGFREKSPDRGAGEVSDADLMGDDGIDALKRENKEMERKKTEREIRKEEHLRAKAAEREERLRGYREKEEGTIGMLKALAKQRFG